MESSTAKSMIIRAGKELLTSELIVRTWGNVSCRINDEKFVITASGKDYETLTNEEVIEVDIKDLSYTGDIQPSIEIMLHRAIYQIKHDVNFIIHTHQQYASAVAAMFQKSITFDKTYEGVGSSVLLSEYAFPGSCELSENVADAIKKTSSGCVIMKNHGAVCYGKTYEEAFKIAYNLEQACKQYLDKYSDVIRNKSNIKEEIDVSTMFSDIDDWKDFSVLLNRDDIVMEYISTAQKLPAYIIDFAMMIGANVPYIDSSLALDNFCTEKSQFDHDSKMKIINILHDHADVPALLLKDVGAICIGVNSSDAKAVSILIHKNCLAYYAANIFEKPISLNLADMLLLRNTYLDKYSKLKYV
jgi:Ribulose-5-phosphate 4-epimerase and related epimerases and aldolases